MNTLTTGSQVVSLRDLLSSTLVATVDADPVCPSFRKLGWAISRSIAAPRRSRAAKPSAFGWPLNSAAISEASATC